MQVESVNLAGLDRVLVAYAAGSSDRSLLLRQYRIAFKKSGTKVCKTHKQPVCTSMLQCCLLPQAASCDTMLICAIAAMILGHVIAAVCITMAI
jgi:hypothetical protein